MKGSDRFLLLIVIGVLLLVALALVLVFRTPPPAYLPEDTPEGVAHNYLLALRQADYERAYRYLDPALPGLPTGVAGFADDIGRNPWQFERGSSVDLAVQGSQVFSDGTARVEVLRTNYNNGLFGSSSYSTTFGLQLRPDNGTWRLVDGEDYWHYCWSNEDCGELPSRVD